MAKNNAGATSVQLSKATPPKHSRIIEPLQHATIMLSCAAISPKYAAITPQVSVTVDIPTLLKMKFEGGSRTEISFQISVFDQHSSSFHIIGKQMKIKYLRLAPVRLKQHMCRGGIPPKIALPSSYLRLAPPELSASIF